MSIVKGEAFLSIVGNGTKLQKFLFTLIRAFPNLGAAVVNVVATFKSGAGAAATFGAGIKGLWGIIKAHPIIAMVTALIVAYNAFKQFAPTVENTQKWLHESSEKVKEAKEKIKTLNDELETTQTRISELQAKGSLTIVEQNELNALKQSNAELKRKIALEERELEIKQKDLSKKFVDSVNAKKNQFYSTQVDITNDKYLETQYDNFMKDNIPPIYGSKKALKEDIERIIGMFREDIGDLGDYDYNTLSDDAKKQLDWVTDWQNKVMLMDSDGKKKFSETVFNSIYSSKRFNDARTAIEAFNKSGELTAEKLKNLYNNNSKVKAMIDNMKDVNLIANTSDKSFNNIVKQITAFNTGVSSTSKSVSEAKKNLKEFFKTLDPKKIGFDKQSGKLLPLSKIMGQMNNYVNSLKDDEAEVLNSWVQKETDKSKINLAYLKDIVVNYREAKKDYDKIVNEAITKGVDLEKTVYGNIDNNNRSIIKWDSANLKKYKSAYESWGYKASDLKGSISTVLGDLDYRDITSGKRDVKNGIPIAFTPMMQTKKGVDYLDASTVDKYLTAVLKKAKGDTSKTNLLKIDAEGIAIDGKKIQGIIADVGDTAKKTSESMHFTGNAGAIQEAYTRLVQYVGAINTIDITKETEGIKNFNSALEESVSATGLSNEAISNIESRLKNVKGYNYSKVFEETAGGVHLNTEELEKLENRYESIEKQKIANKLQYLQAQYNTLTQCIDSCVTTEGKRMTAEQLASYRDEQASIAKQIQDTQTLQSQYEGLTSAYNKWQTAKSGKDERDKYSNIGGDYQNIKDLITQGWVSDSEVQKYLDLMIAADKRTQDNAKDFELLTKKIEGTNFSVMDFFQYDDNKKLTSAGLFNFLDAVKAKLGKKYVEMDEEGKYTFDFTGKKINKVAEELGLTTEAVQILEQALSDAGFDVIFDDMNKNIETAEKHADSSLKKLKKLKSSGEFDSKGIKLKSFDLEETDTKKLQTQINNANTMLDQFKKKDGTINFKAKGAKELSDILLTLVVRKQQLSEPAVMDVDVKSLKKVNKDLGNAIDLVQQFHKKSDEIEQSKTKGLDTSKQEKDLQGFAKKIANLKPKVQAKLGFDKKKIKDIKTEIDVKGTVSKKNIKYIKDTINKINPDDKKLNITASTKKVKKSLKEIKDYQIGDKKFKVLMEGGNEAYTSLSNINSQLAKLKDGSITITTQTVTKGKAKALGSAFANGKMGTNEGGTGLFGELGREILVDPISGTWKTVGDNGAEFVKYRKGSIIFNHRQTEELLKNGKTGRGKSFVGGNAFAGTGAKGGGGSRPTGNTQSADKVQDKSKSKSKSDTKTTDTKSNNKDTKSETDKVLQKFKKWFDSLFDWIEVKLTRQTERIDRYVAKAENALKKNNYSSGSKYYRKAINANITQTQNEKTAYSKYTKEGRITLNKAVKGGVISKKEANTIKKKVQNGTFSFDNYNTKHGARVKEIAEDYKKMYDKAVSAKDAVVTLNNNLLEYCEKLYNIPLDKATAKIDKLSNALNVLTARADAVAGGTKVYNKTHVANAKADKTAADKAYKRSVTKTNSAGKSLLKELSGKDKKKAKAKIKSGKKVSTKGLSDKALKKANAYNAAIDAQKVAKQEASDANKAYQNAKTQQEKYQDKKIPFVDALLPNYSYENKILDEETKNSKQQFKANQIAAREASKNATKVNKQLTKTKDKIKNDDTTIKNAKKYFSSKKAQKALTKEQKKALKKGQVMSTKGLRGDALKQAKAYNKAIKEENKLKKEQKKLSTQAKAAKNAETTATQNAAKAEAEYAKTLQQNAKAKLDNVESSYESVRNIISARINNRKSSIDLKKAQGKKVTSSDYGEIRIQASHDTEMAKKALDDYKKVFNANKGNMSAEDINAAQQKIQELEQAWKDAQKAEEDYLSESIQADIDNVQADIDLLKAKNALLSGSEAKNKNINKQISKTRDEYDLMIQQEKNATKQAQLRAEKEKAILDLLKEQVENIKSEQTLWNNWFSAYNNMITSQKGDIAEALGTDTYGSRTSVYLQNALLQSNTAENDRKEAQKLWDNIHTSDWGTYGDDGVFKVWANKYDDWVAYQTDYWNMIADANKAEAQSYTERYNAWQEQYLNPLKNELETLKTEEEKQNAEINLANAKGLKTTSAQYNSLIANSKLQVNKLEQQNTLLVEQQKLYDPQSKKYKDIQDQIDANTKSISEAAKQQVEWNNAILQLPFDSLEEALAKYDAIKGRISSFISSQKALGNDEGSAAYYEQIATWGDKAATSLAQATKASEYAVKAEADAEGVYDGKTAQEWRNENEKYMSEYYSNLESQQKARGEYVEYALRSYNKLIDGYEYYETVVKGISELIDDEMYFDKDGKITSYGITQIASLVSGYETAKDKIGAYSDELARVNQLYAEGQMTADEYKSKTEELEKGILDGAKDMKSSMSEVIKMYKDMAKTELDALFKLVELRQEALDKKKSYYDFDKTLRKKNKDIESIQSQISALEGIEGAAAKAKRAQLMSDLSEAQEDLEDTLQDHAIQISKDSLSELKESMQEAFDDKWDEISKDLTKQTELWAAASTLASSSVDTVDATLRKLLTYYGADISDLPNAHFASGTTGVGRNMTAYLHENGREGIVTKNGIIMPLLKGEGVLPADATSRLLAMAKGDMSDFISMPDISKANFGSNTPEFTIHQDNSITIEGSADAVTVEQLKKLHNDWVKDAADYTDKKIHRDFLKGGGRRTV